MKVLLKLSFLFTCFQILAQNSFQLTKIERHKSSQKIVSEYNYDGSKAPFLHGVASGDPLPDRVIIWTRVTVANPDKNIRVHWEISPDIDFRYIINSGYVTTNENKDYTVKVDADKLQESTTYYYRFKLYNTYSVIGKTRTSPKSSDEIENLRFAIVSCSNYQAGYFNAYQNIANRSDIDAVIHLGDYIYEYKKGGYGYSSNRPDRGHEPQHEIVTLEDYRVRYSFYRLDPNLQDIHQQHPFITVWDDHEFANDAYMDGAENHSDDEGDWNLRKSNAKKAYFEWLPVRENKEDSNRIYRKISYGKLVDLFMIDTRIEGRTKQINNHNNSNSKKFLAFSKSQKNKLNWAVNHMVENSFNDNLDYNEKIKISNYISRALKTETNHSLVNSKTINPFSIKELNEIKDILNKAEKNLKKKSLIKNRQTLSSSSILGDEQKSWLKNNLKKSSATWKIIGNQVMMTPFGLKINRFSKSWYSFLIPKWMKKWHQLNKDDWNLYTNEKNEILDFIQNNVNNVAILTGDIHMMFASEVERNGSCIIPEFTTPSVTSPNLDLLPDWAIWLLENLTKTTANDELIEDNKHIKKAYTQFHGYYILDIRKNKIQADWYFINTKEEIDPGAYFKIGFKNNINQCGLFEAKQSIGKDRGTYVIDNLSSKEDLSINQLDLLGVYPSVEDKNINIHYGVNRNDLLNLKIYNIQGQIVKNILQDHYHDKGLYNLQLFLNDLDSGIYIIKITNGHQKLIRKVKLG